MDTMLSFILSVMASVVAYSVKVNRSPQQLQLLGASLCALHMV